MLESDVDSVSVNGRGADIALPTAQNLEQDGIVRWRTQLPIATAPNINTLNIELADNSDNTQQASQLLLNRGAIDLSSGNRTILSDENTGSGPTMGTLEKVTLDPANNSVLVADRAFSGCTLFTIDVADGNRTVISNPVLSLF